MGGEPNFRLDLYILYSAFIAFIILAPLMPLVLFVAVGASLRRKKAAGTIYENHFLWLIYTFIYMLIGVLIIAMPIWGFPTARMLILPVLFGFYRIIKGIYFLYKDKPMTDPKTLF